MPPPNSTPETATEILVSALPYIGTENVLDGTIWTVYFKLTNDLNRDAVVTFWYYGTIGGDPAVVYTPDYNLYTEVGLVNSIANAYPNCDFQAPILAGASYWVKVFNFGAGAGTPILNINISLKPYSKVFSPGQIFIPAASVSGYFLDNGGLWAGFINTAGEIVNFIPFFPAAEYGDAVSSTAYLITDTSRVTQPPATGNDNYVLLYNLNFSLVTRVLFPGPGAGNNFEPLIRTNNFTNKFWLVSPGFSGAPNRYATVSPTGILSAITSLPAFTTGSAPAGSHAALNDESFLLVTPNSLINNYAHKWNLNTLAWDGNIGTEVTNYRPSDMLVLADDTIIICYYRDADRRDTIIRRYNLAGAQLNTISIPTAEQISATPRLGYARNRGYFWVWIPKVNGVSLLKKFLASDFSLSVDTAVPNVYQSSIEQANPSLIYVSDSCPIIELESPPMLFKIVPDKRDDYNIAIPNPTFKTALIP